MTRTIAVLAKAPVAGRVKTRLCPPCDPQQAAHLAEAALADTLDAALGVPDVRHVLVLDGEVGSWLPPGIEVLAERGAGLDERLAYAYDDLGGGALLVGMDTPQLTPALLSTALAHSTEPTRCWGRVSMVGGGASDCTHPTGPPSSACP